MSDLVCSLTPTVDEQKTRFLKKIQKELEQGHMLVFTPLLIVNDSETLPSYLTVAFMLMWKDFTMLKMLGGQPIFNNIPNNTSLLTTLKAFNGQWKGYKKTCFVLCISCSSFTEKIMSVVERWDPHCNLGFYAFEHHTCLVAPYPLSNIWLKLHCIKQDLHWQNKSASMLSLPGFFQEVISVIVLLSSSIVGLLSRSSIIGSLPMCLNAAQ